MLTMNFLPFRTCTRSHHRLVLLCFCLVLLLFAFYSIDQIGHLPYIHVSFALRKVC